MKLGDEVEFVEVSDDHARAVHGADVVVVPLPAAAQSAMAERVARALEPGQLVFLTTGTFGSYVFAESVRRFGGQPVPVAENATLPHGVRVTGDRSAEVTARSRAGDRHGSAAAISDRTFETYVAAGTPIDVTRGLAFSGRTGPDPLWAIDLLAERVLPEVR